MRRLAGGLLLALAVAPPVSAQVVVDRVVERVYGQVVTQSDVWQALGLRLVRATTFAGAQREIENRLLLLREAIRLSASMPSAEDVARLRAAWEAAWSPAGDRSAALERWGMTSDALNGWFRDLARIETYLAQRFSNVPEADRDSARAAWTRQLRERAGLPL